MKRCCLFLIAILLLPLFAWAEEGQGTPVTLTVGETVIPAVLNDTAAAQDLLSRLPYTVTVNRGSVDFCGDIGEKLDYAKGDFQEGWEYGDFMWMPEGNWFVFFTEGQESYGKGQWIVLGHMDESWEQLKALTGTITIEIARAEETTTENTLYLEINGQKRPVILANTQAAQELKAWAEQGDFTVTVSDYGGFEKVGALGRSLTRADQQTTTQPGDIVLYSGNNVVIFYGSNAWAYTRLGHLDDMTAQEIKDFLGAGEVHVTFSTQE